MSSEQNPVGTIRRATAVDGEALGRMGAALCRQHHAWDERRFLLPEQAEEGYRRFLVRESSNPRAVVLIAEREGEAVGYAYGIVQGPDWNMLLGTHGALHDLWLDESVRGTGLAKRLLDATVEALEQLGAPRVLLMSASQNERAQRFFARNGFRPTMVEMTRERSKP